MIASGARSATAETYPGLDELTVVVPAKNAEQILTACLASVTRARPREVIVVDGRSSDRTAEIAASFPVKVLSDDGRGLPRARMVGAEAATTRWVALVDADVVLPEGALDRLLEELTNGGYDGLQAGLRSTSGPGYWGRALAEHHRSGRSRSWFGLAATIIDRRLLLEQGFDDRFQSGEDIDLRWRLRSAGATVGVSRSVVVEHRFGDTFGFARRQWLADGHGLGRMVKAHGPRALPLLGLPLAAGGWGSLATLLRGRPQWLLYYVCFVAWNYAGLAAELVPRTRGSRLSPVANSLALIASKVAAMALGFVFWVVAARLFAARDVGLAAGVVAAMMLCTQLATLGLGSAVISEHRERTLRPSALLNSTFLLVSGVALACSALFVFLAAGAFAELGVVGSDPGYTLLFVCATTFGTLWIVLDQVSTALRRGDHALVRGVLFGASCVTALAATALLSDRDGWALVFFPWVVGGLAVCGLGFVQLRRSLPSWRIRAEVDGPLARRLVRQGLPNWALTLAERAPGLLLPVVVIELLSPQANAAWYAAWMMAWVVYIVPIQVGLTLFAELVEEPAAARRSIRRGIRTSLAVGLTGAAAVAIGAELALSTLGPSYAEDGATPLRILVLAVVPLTLVQAWFAACRASGRLRGAIAAGWAGAIASVTVAAAVGAGHGLSGMAVAWVATQWALGAWAALGLLRLRRDLHGSAHAEPSGSVAEAMPGPAP